MAAWRGLPRWLRWPLAFVAFLVLLYVFGFLVFACGSETGGPITPLDRG